MRKHNINWGYFWLIGGLLASVATFALLLRTLHLDPESLTARIILGLFMLPVTYGFMVLSYRFYHRYLLRK